ncbi:MAG: DUF4336 domain-containing protein [Terricaulis sp.]
MVLEQFGDDIWIANGPTVVSAGFRYPTRMALIRLADGGLFAWSPIALTSELRAEVDALGDVHFLVTPTKMHHLSLTMWRNAYPRAVLYAAPGSRERRLEIGFDADLGDVPAPGWDGQIDQVIMRENAIAEEVVFFHRQSGTVLFADLLQNFPHGWFGGLQALIARVDGMVGAEARTPNKFRLAFTDRKTARVHVARILEWPAQKVLMAHGTPVDSDGAAYLRRAFAWLIG